jgi:hypothetical protein
MPLVFLSPLKKTYSAGIISLSTILGLVLLLLAILLPLFAAFSTEDFWLRIKEYIEFPTIDYYERYMTYITTVKGGVYKTFFASSNQELNQHFSNICGQDINLLVENRLRLCNTINSVPSLVSYVDSDMKKNKLSFTYSINPNDFSYDNTENINADIKLIIFLKYTISKKVKLIMTPMIYIDIPIIDARGKIITLNGNLELIQKSPIPSTTITSQSHNYAKPFEIQYNDASPFDLLYYYNKYKSQNYTLKYNYEKIVRTNSENENIEIKIDMNIPKMQKILYVESVYEALKYAWMQYFYIFLPIYIFIYVIFKFIIQNNIFYSDSKSDI